MGKKTLSVRVDLEELYGSGNTWSTDDIGSEDSTHRSDVNGSADSIEITDTARTETVESQEQLEEVLIMWGV